MEVLLALAVLYYAARHGGTIKYKFTANPSVVADIIDAFEKQGALLDDYPREDSRKFWEEQQVVEMRLVEYVGRELSRIGLSRMRVYDLSGTVYDRVTSVQGRGLVSSVFSKLIDRRRQFSAWEIPHK